MQKEYYAFKKITLKDISAELPELSVVYYKTMKMAVISDKCGNSLEVYNMDKKKSVIESFCFHENSGGEFVLHDIALKFQTRVLSIESYNKLAKGKTKEEEENISVEEMLPYITVDLASIGLIVGSKGNRIISVFSNDEYEVKRADAKRKREKIMRENLTRHITALSRQMQKINRTRVPLDSVISSVDKYLEDPSVSVYASYF